MADNDSSENVRSGRTTVSIEFRLTNVQALLANCIGDVGRTPDKFLKKAADAMIEIKVDCNTESRIDEKPEDVVLHIQNDAGPANIVHSNASAQVAPHKTKCVGNEDHSQANVCGVTSLGYVDVVLDIHQHGLSDIVNESLSQLSVHQLILLNVLGTS